MQTHPIIFRRLIRLFLPFLLITLHTCTDSMDFPSFAKGPTQTCTLTSTSSGAALRTSAFFTSWRLLLIAAAPRRSWGSVKRMRLIMAILRSLFDPLVWGRILSPPLRAHNGCNLTSATVPLLHRKAARSIPRLHQLPPAQRRHTPKRWCVTPTTSLSLSLSRRISRVAVPRVRPAWCQCSNVVKLRPSRPRQI